VGYTSKKSATIADVHIDAAEYGLNGVNLTNSTFGDKALTSPVLNISAPFLSRGPSTMSAPAFEGEDFGINYDTSLLLWAYDNKTYHLDYIQKNGNCQAVLVRKFMAKPLFFN
jgi:hypothetical protein